MKNNHKRTIFLSGPMRDVPRADAREWRLKAKKLLAEKFEVLEAYRGREEKETFPDPRCAVARDKSDILRSDIILVDDTRDNVSMIGTSMEVMFAFLQNKIVIIFGNAHPKDYWLNYHSCVRLDTLEQACKLINSMFVE